MSIAADPRVEVKDAGPTPWRFLPVLYVMQAIPVTIVQELMTIVYKDFGVGNEAITKWTSLIALPWSLQMFLGPMVDLTGTKRAWTIRGQAILAAILAAVPFLFNLPFAFELSLLTLAGAAVVSAFVNVATDGFYLLAIPNKDVQASFAGVQTTAYRFGRLLVISGIVFLAGVLSNFRGARAEVVGGAFAAKEGSGIVFLRDAQLKIAGGKLADGQGRPLVPDTEVGSDAQGIAIERDGRIVASVGGAPKELGRLTFYTPQPRQGDAPEATSYRPAEGAAGEGVTLSLRVEMLRVLPIRTAWTIAALAGAAVYALLFLFNRPRIPVPPADAPAHAEPGEVRRNVGRTLAVLTMYGAGYFAVSALWKIAANALSGIAPGWKIPERGFFLGYDAGLSGVLAEAAQFVVAAVVLVGAFGYARRSLRGTAMGEAFASFFRQRGIAAILFFMLTYRFGEAMVAKMSPLFLKDLPSAGGLGIGNEQLSLIKGIAGVVGIIVGGIAGGWIVGKLGLRRALWPLVLVMHLPNLLYLWASIAKPPLGALFVVDFVDQFGYGFGYAGYIVILMRIAQRGEFRTSHYAIGTGLGATFIALAGIMSGVLQAQFGYSGFFASALLLTLPGMASLLFLPLKELDERTA